MGGIFNEEDVKVYLNHLLDRRYYYYDTEYVRSKTMINLNSDEIMSAQEASRIWEKVSLTYGYLCDRTQINGLKVVIGDLERL